MTSVVSGRQSPVRRVSGSGSGAPRHLFVDNVRFWSMFAVVAIHACQVFGEVGGDQPGLVAIIMTPLKFGTIAFFLIAGFLAARGIEASPPGEYLSRRIKRVFFPWLVWMSLFVAWLMASDVVHHSISLSLSPATLFALAGLTRLCLFDTSFWFVPNLLLCLALLLAFRRYLDRLIFGALLLAFSLFYAVNIYKNWIPSSHSEALLGYVFYLWLGTYARPSSTQAQPLDRASLVCLAGRGVRLHRVAGLRRGPLPRPSAGRRRAEYAESHQSAVLRGGHASALQTEHGDVAGLY